MSILTRGSTGELEAMPRPHRWTADEYCAAASAGVLGERRTELIDGEIYDLPAQKNPHVATVSNLNRMLVAAFDERFWVTVQSTIRLPRGDMPEPDFAIRPGPPSSDDAIHPLPLLVIEVSDESLLHDQTIKAAMYAANGVQEYWIVNVRERQIEVHRDPLQDRSRKGGGRYNAVTVARSPSTVTPLANPNVQIDLNRVFS